MSSLTETSPPTAAGSNSTGDAPDAFRRKLLSNKQCLWPRRYIMAFLLSFLLLIRAWRKMNVLFTLAYAVMMEDAHEKFPSIGNWTIKELNNYNIAVTLAEIFAQIPGALLVFIYSSHKFLLASILGSSILQMLTPTALHHHSASLLIVLLGQGFIDAPVRIAIISLWKDWAPPVERTKLIIFSLFGEIIGCAATTFYPYLFQYITNDESYYFAGICGLIWALFWYNITSDTPQNDPLISENELLYLETSIPSGVQQSKKLKDVPWKSIWGSKPILVLCAIFFKMGCSIQVIITCGSFFGIHLSMNYNPLVLFIPFLLTFIIILLISAISADFLLTRFSGRTVFIRKSFLCGGFTLQCCFMFGTITSSELTNGIFYMIAYLFFIASLPGFITLPLDLSPRYVTIIAGFVYTFYVGGYVVTNFFVENTVALLKLRSISWVFLFDGAITFTCVGLFAIWGDVEEQLWSLSFSRGHRSSSGYKSYPKPDDQDELNLVPENV